MTPGEFIDGLLGHFGKRHVSADAERLWMRDIFRCVDGCDRRVLARAYDIALAEHDERAFPLPAQLRAWITRAANDLHTPAAHQPFSPVESEAKPEDAATRKAAVVTMMADFRAAMAARSLPVPAAPAPLAPTHRHEFEAVQRKSPNRDLHLTHKGMLTEISRRITGERDE